MHIGKVVQETNVTLAMLNARLKNVDESTLFLHSLASGHNAYETKQT